MEDVLRQIGTIARSLDSIANIEFKEINLNRSQYLYLVRISENPGIISDRLAEMLSVDRTTTARSIQKLVKNNLVYKKSDQDNKKIKHLFLTDEGEKLAKVIEHENNFSNQMALNGLTEKEQKELARLLKIVEKNANENWQFVKKGGKRKY